MMGSVTWKAPDYSSERRAANFRVPGARPGGELRSPGQAEACPTAERRCAFSGTCFSLSRARRFLPEQVERDFDVTGGGAERVSVGRGRSEERRVGKECRSR